MPAKSDIGNLIIASTISNSIESVGEDEINVSTYEKMDKLNYDILGVTNSEGLVIGFLDKNDSTRSIKRFEVSDIISSYGYGNLKIK